MIVYGKNVVKEAIFAKRDIYQLYLDEKLSDQHFLGFLKDKGIKFQYKTKGELNSLTQNAVHQGIVADVKPYEYKELSDILVKDKRQRFIILDGIEDPHNLGAIMRTAEATALDAIIVSKKGQVPLNATVAKVSSGAIEHVPVVLVTNINQAILTLKKHNVWVVGTDGATTKTFTDLPKLDSIAVILGNEGEGIRPLVKQNCDYLVKIPMYGKINSLNVSVAAALMMYQMI
ncbi:MAG: 23S rRNA (guanosine(2251)-2'-O)-methyltransferase RlmB [Acholeplasmataceae bacterium]|jgi:predicted rRNA methylase|nr:23S rRNA (guanosine(2251)-2'-O)-methyltransferase RlmB [Acholeplasmataceae bacterium]